MEVPPSPTILPLRQQCNLLPCLIIATIMNIKKEDDVDIKVEQVEAEVHPQSIYEKGHTTEEECIEIAQEIYNNQHNPSQFPHDFEVVSRYYDDTPIMNYKYWRNCALKLAMKIVLAREKEKRLKRKSTKSTKSTVKGGNPLKTGVEDLLETSKRYRWSRRRARILKRYAELSKKNKLV